MQFYAVFIFNIWRSSLRVSFFNKEKGVMNKILTSALVLSISFGLTSCKYSQSDLDSAVNQAESNGYNNGYNSGYNDGESDGFNSGYAQGQTDGYSQGYAQGVLDAGNLDYNDGYNDGYADGDTAGYNRGYNDGSSVGYTSGYSDGYTDGDADGYVDGYNAGVADGYNTGYDDGFDDGVLVSYDVGYDDGVNDGYDVGVSDGYNNGFDDGYDVGVDDGYDIGFDDGYDVGYGDGYGIGFDDGWYAAGGSSSDKRSAAQALTATFLNDLIDFDKMKSPKQVLTDPSNKKLLLSSTAGMTVDTKKKKAILNKYIVGAMKNQLITKFGLSEKRSHQIAKLANHMIKASNSGELNMTTVNSFSEKVLGSNFSKMQDAFKKSIKGNSKELNSIVNKAAELNEITPEHTQKIMGQLFL